jgi:hypothetical protein
MQTRKHNRKSRFRPATELWHVGIVNTPIASFVGPYAQPAITWLPMPRSFAFIADPFAIRTADGMTHVLVEALDYRIKRGEIAYYQFDAAMRLCQTGIALRSQTHLSYPYLIEHEGSIYMLPEASRSGKLVLYRATDFPRAWEPVATLLDMPAIDASVIERDGHWWMFFALPGSHQRAMREMHIAYADSLLGPWHLHAGNPVRTSLENARMGGTPFMHGGKLHLPVQDCSDTYGGALQILQVTALSPTEFSAEPVAHIAARPLGHHYSDGCHTLSACGPVTLVDVKHVLHSPMRLLIDLQRRLRRIFR